MTIRVASSSLRILYVTIGQSILRSGNHFIRDYVQRGVVELQYISTDEQVVDILTKSLGRGKFVFFKDKLGVVLNTFLGKREC